MTVADLLARASGRELQAWQQFFKVKAQKDEAAKKEREFMGTETSEVESLTDLLGTA
jgi:hypothetical protein